MAVKTKDGDGVIIELFHNANSYGAYIYLSDETTFKYHLSQLQPITPSSEEELLNTLNQAKNSFKNFPQSEIETNNQKHEHHHQNHKHNNHGNGYQLRSHKKKGI